MSTTLKSRQNSLKRYQKQGVTYTYHRPTGTRLPNLPATHPTMRRLIMELERERRIAGNGDLPARGLDGIRQVDFSTSQITADAIAFLTIHVVNFVLCAPPGKTLVYHSGNLAEDGSKIEQVRDKQRYTSLMAEFGVLSLRQRRVAEGWSHYMATRTQMSVHDAPHNVTMGRISAAEYQALVAVDERQSAVSVPRVIRDALGISDHAASEMRKDMIRAGWITNGRPPELTDLGNQMMC